MSPRTDLINSCTEMLNLRMCIALYTTAALEAVKIGTIDPLSGVILMACRPLLRPVLVSMAIYHCRWSEVASLTIADVIGCDYIDIWQPKSQNYKSVDNRLIAYNLGHLPKGFDVNICLASYSAVIADLDRVIKRKQLNYPPGIQDKTHLFRHLWSSWAHQQGIQKADIAKALGHKELGAVDCYISDYNRFRPLTIKKGR